MNGCAPGLALMERLMATRKWAVDCAFILKENVAIHMIHVYALLLHTRVLRERNY